MNMANASTQEIFLSVIFFIPLLPDQSQNSIKITKINGIYKGNSSWLTAPVEPQATSTF